MLRVVCTLWGDAYGYDIAESLKKRIDIYCTTPYTFHIIDEFDEIFTPFSEKHYRGTGAPSEPRDLIHNGFHRDDFGGIPHHRKLELFYRDVEFADPDDTILYLDLDSRIYGDITDLVSLDLSKPYIVKNYWWDEDPYPWKRQYSINRCPLYNSSVWMWKTGQNRPIIDFISENTDKVFSTYPSIDNFLWHQFGPYSHPDRRDHFEFFPEGFVTTQRELKGNPGHIHLFEGIPHAEKLQYLRFHRHPSPNS